MSENKYIIDKDSLTGIADAVRDKLGTGEATTDPQTGDIIYPEDKGYYLKEGLIAKFNMGDCQIDGGHYSAGSVTYLTVGSASDSTEYNVYFQRPFYSATLSFTHSGFTSRYHTLSVNGVPVSVTAGGTKEFTFSTPQSYLIIKSYIQSAYGTDTFIYQNLTVTLFDKEGNNIGVKTTSIASYNFLTGTVPAKIPFSIGDIQDRINNHLAKRGKREVFVAVNQNTDSVEFNSLNFKLSKYLGIGGLFDLNFKASSPYYITEKIPKINPENISFIYFKGFDGRYGSEYQFIFDSSVKSVEHYTSASIKEGKRLSSATDYYFYPDTNGSYKSSGNYGIMGMWDKNNKILDLGFQLVSSRSGNSISSNYTPIYQANTRDFIIVYEEATE